MKSADRARIILQDYTGGNEWEDVFEPLGVDEDESENYAGWASGELVIFEDGSGLEYNPSAGEWEVLS